MMYWFCFFCLFFILIFFILFIVCGGDDGFVISESSSGDIVGVGGMGFGLGSFVGGNFMGFGSGLGVGGGDGSCDL